MIQIGKKGHIVKGIYEGWYIMVQDDTEGATGGYYVLISSIPDFQDESGEGYDDWVESKEGLSLLFAQRNWEIKWEP